MSQHLQSNEQGLTLVELLIAIAIAAIIGAASSSFITNFLNISGELAARESADQDYEVVSKLINVNLAKANRSTIKMEKCKTTALGDTYCEKLTFKSLHNSIAEHDVEINSKCHLIDEKIVDADIKKAVCKSGSCTNRVEVQVRGKYNTNSPPSGSKSAGLFLCMQQNSSRFRFHYLSAYKIDSKNFKKTGRLFSLDLFNLEGEKIQDYIR